MDSLQRVSAVASLAVRHVGAYADLIADDVSVALDGFSRRLMVSVILIASAGFSVALACVWAIVAVWDTTARLWVIALLAGLFALVASWALLTLRRLGGDSPGILSRTADEWQKDRLLLEELLPPVGGGVP